MRILFISRWFPYPANNGSKIRIINLIRQLSTRHEITLISFVEDDVSEPQVTAMESYCRAVHTVPYKAFNPTRLRALLGLLSTRPRSVVDTYNPEMATLIQNVNAQNDFDVVIASEIDCAPYAIHLKTHATGTRPQMEIPRVLEDLELAVIRDQPLKQDRLASRLRYGLTWLKLRNYVVRLLQDFEGCTVVSQEEQELLMQITRNYQTTAIVPNGVDLDVNSGDFGAPKRDTLIYPGALTYHANFDAMAYFLRDIFPLIKVQRPGNADPGLQMRITGGYRGVPVEDLALNDNVELTGYLDDIRPAIAQSWVCVVPLRVGGGTRLKILEAMALGTPVVSTSKGAEGLDVIHNHNILIADDPKHFAQAVTQVLEDEDLRTRLSRNGRQLVEERYAWDICVRKLEELLLHIVQTESVGSERQKGRESDV